MNIGVPRERRPFEFRVGLSPSAVNLLTQHGHKAFVEHDAGLGAGFSDQEYEQAGARIVYSGHEVFGRADLLIKVARPLLEEILWLRPDSALAGLLHLGSARQDKIDALLENNITAIALEKVRLQDGTLPIRRPLAQIGGLMVPQIAARLLQNDAGGKGILLSGMAGVPPAEVVIIGAGVVGTYATQACLGVGAHVTVLDNDLNALQRIYERFPGVVTMMSNLVNLKRVCTYADVLVGAVLVPGERAPILISREMLRTMKHRAIIMDLSIDEGGCVETSRPTTHDHPTFIEEGVIHYCVPNIPGIVARTSTHAYISAALPFIQEMADNGIDRVIQENQGIAHGIDTHKGKLVNLIRSYSLAMED
jgi:alanine dehydrogenase